ncbi:MAG: CcoQ/FixQ family Cbb3-type cytochrome c oxidase assembly chaperone [Bacteroidetes bacterium]|nr:CcoQ/FixQ family Cbb3-type cytochrome c oxidase assembly chaperone [Bacteroidota bacterium]MBS1931220.1 CcoQ/FixQ family Cbb3-type cytochrome c oxidase assembly chaperone [Bacteroidota bacterium]
MFKFIKQYAETIDRVDIYPIISLLAFFVFFIAMLYYVKKMDKTKVNDISRMPLENENEHSELITQNYLK